ncbi:MAG: M23 family metallopeptidase [Myxococcota bacterium]
MRGRCRAWLRAAGLVAVASGCGEPAADPPSPSTEEPKPSPDAAPAPAPVVFEVPPGLEALPRMDWPVEIVHITSDFGWRVDPVSGRGTRLHGGVDLRGAIGDPALSVADGTVVFAGHDALLGNHVIVDHGLGVQSFYGHLSALLVHEGIAVERGAAIGLIGNTGRSAAPHLHLTIKVDGVAVDPIGLIGEPLHNPGALTARPDAAAPPASAPAPPPASAPASPPASPPATP